MKRLMLLAGVLVATGCGPNVGQEYRTVGIVQGYTSRGEFEERARFAQLIPNERVDAAVGGLLMVSDGKRVRVIDACPAGVRIEVLEGDAAGNSGWVKAEGLTRP